MRARRARCQGGVGPLRRTLDAALDDDICVFVTLQVVLVTVCPGGRGSHGGHGQTGIAGRSAAVGRLAGAARYPAAAHHVVALVHGLHRHDEVVAVGDHHVRHLVQGLPSHFDAVDLQHLVVNRQQPGAFRQAPGHQPGYEDAGDFLQPVWGHPYAGSVSDVKTQGFV